MPVGFGHRRSPGRGSEPAQERLLAIEARARSLGFAPLLARVGHSLRRAGVRRSAAGAARSGVLTARERAVLRLVADGLSSREIGAHLGVAPSTVDSQVKSAMRKLGTHTRAHAALMAGDDGR